MPVDAGSRSPSPMDIARVAADAARSHDDVVDLDGGVAGEFATYGFGGRVPGIRVEETRDGRTRVRLRLVVRFGRPLPDVGDEVRSRVIGALGDLTEPEVHVHVADITSEDAESSPGRAELDHPGVP